MKAAVLCPGPSLQFLRSPVVGYDATWAVNTALKLQDADWFSAADMPLYKGLVADRRPRIGALTMGSTMEKARTLPDWLGVKKWVPWSNVSFIDRHVKTGRHINWSLQAALCHAAELGAKTIDIYGCDLAGTVDASGYGGEERTEDRWQREARDLQFTTEFLSGHGVTINRIKLCQ